jgi:replication-associated recombination protein RarA
MQSLYEQYRPASFAEVVGQDKAVKRLEMLESRGQLSGRAFWISGKSGTGKTSIARIIAAKLSDEWHTVEIDAGQLTLKAIAEIRDNQHYRPMTCAGRAYIINEAHGLRKDVIRALLVLLEELAPYTVIVFTTTVDGQVSFEDANIDAGPLLSRCISIELSQRGLAKAFAERVREIAVAESLDGLPIERYIRLANDNQSNFRAMLQSVESGAMMADF